MALARRVVRGARADRLLLLLHGYGADEHDLAALVPHLDPEGRFLTICPRGPLPAPPGAAWYHFSQAGADPAAVHASLASLDALVDEVCAEERLDRRRAVMAGFSQGGSMALALSLRTSAPARPAAVVCMSGFLLDVPGLDWGWGAPDLPPVLVQHGTHDPVVPPHRGRAAAEALAAHGVAVRHLEYPMAHQIVLESVDDARTWLAEVLAGPGRGGGDGGEAGGAGAGR